ncbi:DUF599 domain-containing protein [Fluviibacterium sp. DFM31]|uniref:DUF599 domain-containing protein n=2 Tax=Meridianimarinicoccus marinus TaxID=3231483 RepID=A0ABV3L300_9RHOB
MIPAQLGLLNWLDAVALLLLLVAWQGVGVLIEHPPRRFPSVSVLMTRYRRIWMSHVITREPRVFDSMIVGSLRQGTAFFASTAMIALGGGLALVGNIERLTTLASELSLAESSKVVLEMKLILILLLVVNAFLKFVWANRIFGYCAVMLGTIPNEVDDPVGPHRCQQAAELNITAAKAFNRGLRSIYFAMGALAWLVGALPLILTTLLTVAVVLRREFGSQTRDVLLQGIDD